MTPAPTSAKRVPTCPICDLPAVCADGHEPWQGNENFCCERFFLARSGLRNDFATRRCIDKGQNWRKRYIEATAKIAELETALRTARGALSRHHDAALRDKGVFRNGARITG